MKKCETCNGKGYILALSFGHPKGDKLRVERCDDCKAYKTDKEAKHFYKAEQSKKKHFEKWFNKFLRSDNVIKTKGGYRTQCTNYSILYTKQQLRKYYKNEYYKLAWN